MKKGEVIFAILEPSEVIGILAVYDMREAGDRRFGVYIPPVNGAPADWKWLGEEGVRNITADQRYGKYLGEKMRWPDEPSPLMGTMPSLEPCCYCCGSKEVVGMTYGRLTCKDHVITSTEMPDIKNIIGEKATRVRYKEGE